VVSIAGLPNARFGKAYGVAWWKRLAFGLATRQLTRLEKQSHATYTFLFMQPNGAQLTQLAQFVEAGIITPVIDRVVPFDQLNQALAYSQAGQAVGKIILKIGQEA
jgi:NADPH:quinone reductase and related Zn-dependent oxidoreductases